MFKWDPLASAAAGQRLLQCPMSQTHPTRLFAPTGERRGANVRFRAIGRRSRLVPLDRVSTAACDPLRTFATGVSWRDEEADEG
jgi:hypothetical protein